MSEYSRDPHSQALLAPIDDTVSQLEVSLHKLRQDHEKLKTVVIMLIQVIKGTPSLEFNLRDIEECYGSRHEIPLHTLLRYDSESSQTRSVVEV